MSQTQIKIDREYSNRMNSNQNMIKLRRQKLFVVIDQQVQQKV
jgi:hypothetical protein